MDAAGEVTPLYPEAGDEPAGGAGRGHALAAGQLEFTGSGAERVVVVLTDAPLAVEAARAAAARRPSRRPGGTWRAHAARWTCPATDPLDAAQAVSAPRRHVACVPPLRAVAGAAAGHAPRGRQPLRRFALIAGNDEGGADTRPLLYARDDARKMHGILLPGWAAWPRRTRGCC